MAYVEAELPAPLSSEYKEVAWAVPKFGEHHRPIWIARPKVTDYQVKFEMLYCGKFFFRKKYRYTGRPRSFSTRG
jgi:hypothetical protein